MIDKRVASEQVERLAGLDWYPHDGLAQIELIRAAESAENEFIAAHVVNEWVKYYTAAPKPAQLRALIHAENEKLRLQKRKPDCERCENTGVLIRWVISWTEMDGGEMVRKRAYVASEGYGLQEVGRMTRSAMASVCSAAVPCSCTRGGQ